MNNELFHKTKDGVGITICMMEDSHLLNTINLHLRRMLDAQDILRGQVSTDMLTEIIFYQEKKNLEAESRSYLQRAVAILPRYVFEACVRGLITTELVDRIRVAMGRNTMVSTQHFEALSGGFEENE